MFILGFCRGILCFLLLDTMILAYVGLFTREGFGFLQISNMPKISLALFVTLHFIMTYISDLFDIMSYRE